LVLSAAPALLLLLMALVRIARIIPHTHFTP
jgi:hypothetical protein